uniref:Phosphoglucomutase, cytoplasmic-like n=1 Tax=Nicotiana sylvestris TaxID=4096 RepID=A0A1U7XST8_NICSY|nr:PREDICTED: phosphoglucomutase, cytoplasmic-like [Nicotiana sylvestris]
MALTFESYIKLDGLFQVKVFIQPYYLQNFGQATFNALGADRVKGATLVVSGDGRYYSKDAIQIITKMAVANGVRRVWMVKMDFCPLLPYQLLFVGESGLMVLKLLGHLY